MASRAETNLEWVTPHTFRKTVATLIDREADIKTAAAQLGHASEEVTDKYYIAKPVLAPDVSESSNNLAPIVEPTIAHEDTTGRSGPRRGSPDGDHAMQTATSTCW
jgi:hypothetical protein